MALSIHNGTRIPPFEQGDKDRTTQSAETMNEILDALNALLNPIVVKSTRNKFTLANNALVLELQDATEIAGNVRYRGEYDNEADPPYTKFDIVRVSPSNVFSTTQPDGTTVPGVYICILDNPDKDADFPTHPLQAGGESTFWNWLSTWPSEIKVCNSETNQIEDWFIDGQKKPVITMDSEHASMDGAETMDS